MDTQALVYSCFDLDVYFWSLPFKKDVVEARKGAQDNNFDQGDEELPYKERPKSYDFG